MTLAAGAGYFVPLHVPHKTVALPVTTASPTDVLNTYVRAINDRDYSTANALLLGGTGLENHGWFDAPSIKHLKVTHVTGPYSGARDPTSSVTDYKQVVEVDTEAHFDHWPGGNDGQKMWSYYLARNANTQPWRVVAQGQA
ncbi:DUF4829 domain-containing protein [Allobranchiibius sp. GilTou73]|uniref:DUF4829 domain-containing protein n=1 Tax=Allobranchiibius sp. GilTou73 TaxID=2904523 RepID=UPI001F186B2D|nr:DUF4829 domain-containing protein [Allobranchiibius sp. GilTou73]UIJ35622.1 DUF4829 domain-containing protein [Allobranchiibius sp. GilTou73]